jgi:hypothetical protein
VAKLTLDDLSNITGNEQSAITTINNNSAAIEAAIENTLSRDGTTPNSMGADLDMNSNDLLNVKDIDVQTITADTIESADYTQDGISITTLLLDWEGPWTASTAYLVGDLVQSLGSSFICIQAHSSTVTDQPPVGAQWETYWNLVAQKGDQGTVASPGSSTDMAVVRFDGTLGNSIQNSVVTISDTGAIATPVVTISDAGAITAPGLTVSAAGAIATPGITISAVGAVAPTANDAGALGTSTLSFADLFLAELGVINWNNGATTLAQRAAGALPGVSIGGAGNVGVEIGRADNVASTPFIDFHSGATSTDYDVRLIANGGTGSDGGGTLTVTAANVNMGTSAPLTVGSIELGAASDTTITRTGAGSIAVEGNTIYRAGGTDVPVADGGTGVSSLTAYAVLCGGTTSTGAVQSIASVGTAGTILTSNGAGALPTFQTPAASGMALLTSGTVSSAATLDLVLTSYTAYRGLIFYLTRFLPATDDVDLWMRVSTNGGSSYDSGASDYVYAGLGTDSGNTQRGSASSAAAQILLTSGTSQRRVDSTTSRGVHAVIDLFGQTSTTLLPRVGFRTFAGAQDADNTSMTWMNGEGMRATAQDTDAVRFLFSSGNISSGTYAVYGLN